MRQKKWNGHDFHVIWVLSYFLITNTDILSKIIKINCYISASTSINAYERIYIYINSSVNMYRCKSVLNTHTRTHSQMYYICMCIPNGEVSVLVISIALTL